MTETRPTPPPPPALARLLAVAARHMAASLRAEAGPHGHPTYDYETGPGMARAADQLDAHANRPDQLADPDEHETPGWRHVLTEDEYDAAYLAALHALGPAPHIGSATIELVLGTGLARLGILPPPPDPEPGACTEQWATPHGYWVQCAEDTGHDPAEGHDDGEWSWPHPDADAPIPYTLTPAALMTGD
ncbi:hypothetical protein N0X72_25435 [Streptomyces carpaticus]|uniref:hypothetical protein n=1 Tax=Streptomyces carpaticus TaxID=285558 RepID=UPI002202EA39|nr:hypothetical protein N0X72_25435 [Streptomyces carpaticus]